MPGLIDPSGRVAWTPEHCIHLAHAPPFPFVVLNASIPCAPSCGYSQAEPLETGGLLPPTLPLR